MRSPTEYDPIKMLNSAKDAQSYSHCNQREYEILDSLVTFSPGRNLIFLPYQKRMVFIAAHIKTSIHNQAVAQQIKDVLVERMSFTFQWKPHYRYIVLNPTYKFCGLVGTVSFTYSTGSVPYLIKFANDILWS